VNLIEKAGLYSEKYDRVYWLAAVKRANFDHPETEMERLPKRMMDVAAWLTTKHGLMNKGGWLTNRLREEAAGPQPRPSVHR